MKGIFDFYMLWPFDKKVDFLISNKLIRTRDYMLTLFFTYFLTFCVAFFYIFLEFLGFLLLLRILESK